MGQDPSRPSDRPRSGRMPDRGPLSTGRFGSFPCLTPGQLTPPHLRGDADSRTWHRTALAHCAVPWPEAGSWCRGRRAVAGVLWWTWQTLVVRAGSCRARAVTCTNSQTCRSGAPCGEQRFSEVFQQVPACRRDTPGRNPPIVYSAIAWTSRYDDGAGRRCRDDRGVEHLCRRRGRPDHHRLDHGKRRALGTRSCDSGVRPRTVATTSRTSPACTGARNCTSE